MWSHVCTCVSHSNAGRWFYCELWLKSSGTRDTSSRSTPTRYYVGLFGFAVGSDTCMHGACTCARMHPFCKTHFSTPLHSVGTTSAHFCARRLHLCVICSRVAQLLRPRHLLRFVSFLHSNVHPSSPLYFGSSSAGGGGACSVRDSEACRTFRFNKGVDATVSAAMRLRETDGWRALEAAHLSTEERAVANITQVSH